MKNNNDNTEGKTGEGNVAVAEPTVAKTATGDAVTDSAGKPILATEPMVSKPEAPATPKDITDMSLEEISSMLLKIGVKSTPKALEQIKHVAKAARVESLKEIRDKEMAKLVAIHDELRDAMVIILAKAEINCEDGKMVRLFKGNAGSLCCDICYPEPIPDVKARKTPKEGEARVRYATSMGEVHLRIPELEKVDTIPSLAKFYAFWTGKTYEGFTTATIAVQNIGDGRDGKSAKHQDGVFKVENIAAVAETPDKIGQPSHNIVTLTDKGYAFFGITKGAKAKTAAPATVPSAQVATAEATATEVKPVATAQTPPAIGGNQLCPCNSGRKFKNCCGKK